MSVEDSDTTLPGFAVEKLLSKRMSKRIQCLVGRIYSQIHSSNYNIRKYVGQTHTHPFVSPCKTVRWHIQLWTRAFFGFTMIRSMHNLSRVILAIEYENCIFHK
jgi:hypothetical protein